MNRRDNAKGWAIFAVILGALALVGHLEIEPPAPDEPQPTTYHF